MITLGLPFPPDSGARIRDFNLIREISRNAKVCLCSLLTEDLPPNIDELWQYCETIETYGPPRGIEVWVSIMRGWRSGRPVATRPFYFPGMATKIRSILESHSVDLVQIEHSFLACYRDELPSLTNCRTVLSLHNVGSRQYQRMVLLETGILSRFGFRIKASLMRSWEAGIAARFDRCIVVSDEEAHLLHAENSSLRVAVIENGVDCERFQPLPDRSPEDSLLFFGVLSYPPNTDAMVWFTREIWPRIRSEVPRALFNIVGHSPPPALRRLDAIDGVSVIGPVKDPVPAYERCKIAIVPLRAGGGTRLKILEAMALGRMVISTSIGCEGLDVVSGYHLIVADTPTEFTAAVVRALRDPELRERISANARNLVENRYSWKIIGSRLSAVHMKTAASHVAS